MVKTCDIRFSRLAKTIVAVVLSQFACGAAKSEPVAFPGAVGQGAAAVGGRGGDVYHVTNLSDYSEDKGEAKIEGSLRHAIRSASGPRTIAFDVGGAIQLHAPLEIRKNKLTIAGQTAPGGITTWGYPVNVTNASDVVIRYVRVRTGDFNARSPKASSSRDIKSAGNGEKDLDAGSANAFDVGRADRVILDHLSAAWGMDETLSVTHSRNITVQNTIIAESLNSSFHPKGPHGYGTLIRGELTAADQEAGIGGYTFFGNLWALHRARNPSIGGEQRIAPGQPEAARRRTDVNIVNNVIYGWGDSPTHRSDLGEVRINFVGNYAISGPASKADCVFREGNAGRTSLYQRDNMLDSDRNAIHNGTLVGEAGDIQRTFQKIDANDVLLSPPRGKPFNFFAGIEGQVLSPDEAYTRVVHHVGSSLARDAIDTRIVDCVIHRTGSLIDSQQTFRDADGHLPGIDDLTVRRRDDGFDTDRDAMSNEFELLHNLDPNDPSDRNGTSLSHDGYTNLEVYLNGLLDEHPQK